LEPGESLRLDMFENNANGTPVASQTYNPSASMTFVGLSSPGSWLDYQGEIRLTMLAGSVEVDLGHFFVRPDPFRYCDTYVVVPEPGALALSAFGSGILGITRLSRRGKKHFNLA
jgi:hypothetical protein